LQIAGTRIVRRTAWQLCTRKRPEEYRRQERTRQAQEDPITIGSRETPDVDLRYDVVRAGLHIAVSQRLRRRRRIRSQYGESVDAGPVQIPIRNVECVRPIPVQHAFQLQIAGTRIVRRAAWQL